MVTSESNKVDKKWPLKGMIVANYFITFIYKYSGVKFVFDTFRAISHDIKCHIN